MITQRLSWKRLTWLCLLGWSLPAGVRAAGQNVTIDDRDNRIQYSDGWNLSGACASCLAKPPDNQTQNAHDETWRDATNFGDSDIHFTVSFTGSACYVYGILRDGDEGTIGYTTRTNLTFTMDNKVVDHFLHIPSGTDQWLFNQLVFSKQGMKEDSHTLTVTLDGRSLLLFDYMVYTTEVPDSGSSTTSTSTSATATSTGSANNSNNNTAKIAGAAGAIVGALVLLGLGIFFLLRRRKRRGVQLSQGHQAVLLDDIASRPGSPMGSITPFYQQPPEYEATEYTRQTGEHGATVLLAGAPVRSDRKGRANSLYTTMGTATSSSLYDPWHPPTTITSTGPLSHTSAPTTVVSPSVYGGVAPSSIMDTSVYGGMASRYTDTASTESHESPPTPKRPTVTPPRPPPLTIPPPPPVSPPVSQQPPSLYPLAISGAQTAQRQAQQQAEQAEQAPSLMSPPPLTAMTILPPYSQAQSPTAPPLPTHSNPHDLL